MRKCHLAASLPSQSWSPRFKTSCRRANPAEKTGQKNTSVMTYFPTWKGGKRMERLRHYFHADMAALLEIDPDVLRWTTEVGAYCFREDGDDIAFTPNFLVSDVVGTRVIRLVRDEDMKRARRDEQHRLLKRLFQQRGMQFDVLTEDELAAHPRLPIAKHILFHRYWDVPDEMPLHIAALAAADHPATLGQLQSRLGGSPDLWPQLLSLVAQGYVDIDTDRRLGPQTPILACKLKGHCQ